jgi:hypothetical protein
MGCLGALIILARIAGFVVVLVAYPKQTLGCGIALLAIAAIGIAVIIHNDEEKSQRWRARENAITAAVVYSPRTCGDSAPLAITVRNGSSETLGSVEMRLEAYRPGHSTDLLQSSYSDHTLKWDKILPPGQSETLCYSLPASIATSTADTPVSLEFRIDYKSPTFRFN